MIFLFFCTNKNSLKTVPRKAGILPASLPKQTCGKHAKSIAKRDEIRYNKDAVLGGESAVPCICNPL